jgi:hypothetical protein
MLTIQDEEERETLCESKDYLNVRGKFLIEALHYNLNVAEYEPVLESWGLNMDLIQHSINQDKSIQFIANKMLNLNFSYAGKFLYVQYLVSNALGIILKRLKENEEHWRRELEEYKSELARDTEELSMKNINTEGFIFENNLYVPIIFYVQTMSGEKEPKSFYTKFIIESDSSLFLSKDDLVLIRREEAKLHFGQSLKLISEDMLRIMIQLNHWKFAPDIPIELGGCHSFIVQHSVSKLKKKFREYSLPVLCRVSSNVRAFVDCRNHIRLLLLSHL